MKQALLYFLILIIFTAFFAYFLYDEDVNSFSSIFSSEDSISFLERIEGYLSFTEEAKAEHYFKVGNRLFALGEDTNNIDLLKKSKEFYMEALELPVVKENENFLKVGQLSIFEIAKREKKIIFEAEIDSYNNILFLDYKTTEKNIDNYYRSDAFIDGDYLQKISDEKQIFVDKLSNLLVSYDEEVNNMFFEYKNKAKQVEEYEELDSLTEKYNSLLFQKYKEYKKKISKEDDISKRERPFYEEFYSFVSRETERIDNKIGTIKQNENIIAKSLKIIKEDFLSLLNIEEFKFKQDLMGEVLLSIEEDREVYYSDKMIEYKNKITEITENKLNNIEELRTLDKYELLSNFVLVNKNKALRDVDNEFYKIKKDISSLVIDGLNSRKEIVLLKESVFSEIENNYFISTEKINELLSSEQPSINIDREINDLILASDERMIKNVFLFKKEVNAIRDITNYVLDGIDKIYSLESVYKETYNKKINVMNRDSYDMDFIEFLKLESIKKYRTIILKNKEKIYKNTISGIIKNNSYYSQAYDEIKKDTSLNYIYLDENNLILKRWNNLYDISFTYNSIMPKVKTSIDEVVDSYNEYISKMKDFEYKKNYSLLKISELFNIFIKDKNVIAENMEKEIADAIVQDIPLSEKDTLSYISITTASKETKDLINISNKTISDFFNLSNYLNKGFVLDKEIREEINSKIQEYLLKTEIERTDISKQYDFLMLTVNEDLDSYYFNYTDYISGDETIILSQSSFENYYSGYEESISSYSDIVLKLIDVIYKVEVDLSIPITDVLHLEQEIYNYAADIVRDYSLNSEDIYGISNILNDYSKDSLSLVADMVSELQQMYLDGEVSKDEVDDIVNNRYKPLIKSISEDYIKKIRIYEN